MSTDPRPLAELQTALEAQFGLAAIEVPIAGRPVRILRPPSVDALISEEDFAVDERLPYWAEIWPAARALAEMLAIQAGDGRRLIELGCGAGLVSAVACAAGFDVLATDYYQPALDFTRLNCVMHAAVEPRLRLVDWRNFPADLGQFDVVVAADVLYERGYDALVAAAFRRSLAPRAVGYVADPQRQAATGFERACAAEGLRVMRLMPREVDLGTRRQEIDVFRIALEA